MKSFSVFLLLFLLFQSSSSQTPQFSVLCQYFRHPFDFFYYCRLLITNFDSYDGIQNIPGELPSGVTNDEIMRVEATTQISPIIPSVICRQFPNLRELIFTSSRVNQLTAAALENCGNLEVLQIDNNLLTSLSDGIFNNNPRLRVLNLNSNQLTSLPENIFAQTSLRTLNLNANQFTTLNPLRSWFANTANLLEVLTFMTNSLDYLPGDAFEGFTSITQLNLDNNPLLGLDFNVFYPLEALRILSLSRCNLTTLRSDLFVNLYQLTEMNLALNGFSILPDGVFNSLYRLTDLILSGNQLTRVSSLAFGEATTALEVLNISDNGMEAFDEIIFDSAENLRWLFLAGNECISQSFTNVRTQREAVRASLENCFNSF